MPYIAEPDRKQYQKAINDIVKKIPECRDDAVGHLNYVFFTIVRRHLKNQAARNGRVRYADINAFVTGVFGHCQHELLRRVADELEDAAIRKNGDAF